MAAESFPSYHVTGPVHHYIRVPESSQIWYLGTCETTPKVKVSRTSVPIFNDIAGRTLPAQKAKGGQMGIIGLMLTRFSKDSYELLGNLGLEQGTMIEAGWESRWSRGALLFGVETFELWQIYENSLNAGFRTPGLELGRYWPQVEVLEDNIEAVGTEGEKLYLVLEAQGQFQPQQSPSQVAGNERSRLLYIVGDPALAPNSTFPADVLVPQ